MEIVRKVASVWMAVLIMLPAVVPVSAMQSIPQSSSADDISAIQLNTRQSGRVTDSDRQSAVQSNTTEDIVDTTTSTAEGNVDSNADSQQDITVSENNRMELPTISMGSEYVGGTANSSTRSTAGNAGNGIGSSTNSTVSTINSAANSATGSEVDDADSQIDSVVNEDSSIVLPYVSVGSQAAGVIANGTDITPSNTMQTLLGVVFWVCIVIGILIVIVVIMAAARKHPKGGTGKKRYERRPMTPKGKRILNGRYYRNIKK